VASTGWEHSALILREVLNDLASSVARADKTWDQSASRDIALCDDKRLDLRVRVRNQQTTRVEESRDGGYVLVHENRKGPGHSSCDLASGVTGIKRSAVFVVEDDLRSKSVA
jgi:hypothetical protein